MRFSERDPNGPHSANDFFKGLNGYIGRWLQIRSGNRRCLRKLHPERVDGPICSFISAFFSQRPAMETEEGGLVDRFSRDYIADMIIFDYLS